MRLIMADNKPLELVPIALAAIGVMQFLTIVFVLGIPTNRIEMVCRGNIENPNLVMCYEQ